MGVWGVDPWPYVRPFDRCRLEIDGTGIRMGFVPFTRETHLFYFFQEATYCMVPIPIFARPVLSVGIPWLIWFSEPFDQNPSVFLQNLCVGHAFGLPL